MITVFTLPYEFENIVYNLKPGQVSKPIVQKKDGIFLKMKKKDLLLEKSTIAQILFAVPAGNNIIRDHAKQLADSVYNALKSGADLRNGKTIQR